MRSLQSCIPGILVEPVWAARADIESPSKLDTRLATFAIVLSW